VKIGDRKSKTCRRLARSKA